MFFLFFFFCFFFFFLFFFFYFFFFFFQAEDGIRDTSVTGVQTCALPVWARTSHAIQSRIYIREKNGYGDSDLEAVNF